MMNVLVTATNYSKYCKPGKELLLKYGCNIIENPHNRPYTREELLELVDDIDGVVCGVDTWDEDVFQKAARLKGIARFGVGVDNIDIKSAKEHHITVCNCPGINTSAVAEQTMALLLSLTRKITYLNEEVRKGNWVRPMAHELKSQRVGLLGFGAIAQKVALMLSAFGAEIIAYDKYPNQEKASQLKVELLSLEEVIAYSDILSIHLPAVEDTYHLISQDSIAKMKDGVYLINTARGSIVDEHAVAQALDCGKIAGFATDVFEKEPVSLSHPLFASKHFVATPHTCAETYENCEETSLATAQALIDIFEGREPKNKL